MQRKVGQVQEAGQGDHYHIPPPSPCCKLFSARMKYLFACKIVRNFPSRDQHRSSSSSALQYRGEMGSWQTCMGCLTMFSMESLYSWIPQLQLQPFQTKHPRFLECELCTQCAARVPRRGTQLHLATFANFSQREQWKFKQWCKWMNCNFVVFELFEIFFSHKLLVFVRGEQPEVSQVCAPVPCEGCWCTASGTQHCN